MNKNFTPLSFSINTRPLTLDERIKLIPSDISNTSDQHSNYTHGILDEKQIPTKIVTIIYNDKKYEFYE